MIRTPAIANQSSSKLLLGACQELADLIKAEVPWLNYSFGKATRFVKGTGKDRFFYPVVYLGKTNNTAFGNRLNKDDYLSLLPDEHIGNYSFWSFPGVENVSGFGTGNKGRISTEFTLVFWFDLAKVFPDKNTPAYHGLDDVKDQLINVLSNLVPTKSRYEITTIYEKQEDLFRYYSGFLESISNDTIGYENTHQNLMYPFAGLGFHGTITLNNATSC